MSGVRRFLRFMRSWALLTLLIPLPAGAADDKVNPLEELRSPKAGDLRERLAETRRRREQERRESYEYYTLWTNCGDVGLHVFVQNGEGSV